MPDVPHLTWPLRMAGPRLAAVEQDSIEDVRQCVHVLLRTPPGARPLAPEVGIDDPTFGVVDPGEITGYLADHEPRAVVSVTETGPDAGGRQAVTVAVALAEEVDPSGRDDLEDIL